LPILSISQNAIFQLLYNFVTYVFNYSFTVHSLLYYSICILLYSVWRRINLYIHLATAICPVTWNAIAISYCQSINDPHCQFVSRMQKMTATAIREYYSLHDIEKQPRLRPATASPQVTSIEDSNLFRDWESERYREQRLRRNNATWSDPSVIIYYYTTASPQATSIEDSDLF